MSFAAPRPPRPSLSLVRGPPVFRLRLRRGADLALGVRLAFCSLCWCCRMRGHAPRLRRCPPSLGLLGEDLGVAVRVGALVKLTASLGAPRRKTPTFKKPPECPRFGGQRRAKRGAGGLSHDLQHRRDAQNSTLRWGSPSPIFSVQISTSRRGTPSLIFSMKIKAFGGAAKVPPA
jgi:hypothetical protein